jgi:hypothetical protein
LTQEMISRRGGKHGQMTVDRGTKSPGPPVLQGSFGSINGPRTDTFGDE